MYKTGTLTNNILIIQHDNKTLLTNTDVCFLLWSFPMLSRKQHEGLFSSAYEARGCPRSLAEGGKVLVDQLGRVRRWEAGAFHRALFDGWLPAQMVTGHRREQRRLPLSRRK